MYRKMQQPATRRQESMGRSEVKQIYDIALRYAPDFDAGKITEELLK